MPSGGVRLRARGASDPLEAAAQARGKRRHSAEPSTLSPSRQLDFGAVRHEDEETHGRRKKKKQRLSEVAARERIRDAFAEEESEDEEPEQEPRTPPRKKRASSEGDEPRTAITRSPGTPGRRRHVRMWTKEEEDELIAGVRKHGMGAWRKILEEGEDVFHVHRTNVDLKDKWKNLVRREVKSPAREQRNRAARLMAARLSLSSQGRQDVDRASVASSNDSTVDVEAMFPDFNEEDAAEDQSPAARRRSSSLGGDVQLLICTDATAPNMRSLSVSSRRCPTISALKRELTRRLLDDSPLPTNLQLVSITTRRLLADLEALDECIERDGREFFLLYDP